MCLKQTNNTIDCKIVTCNSVEFIVKSICKRKRLQGCVKLVTDMSYRILIVDDNPNNLIALRLLINEYINAEVLEAPSGEKALKILLEQWVDLILLDVQMDGMDGFQVASYIKGCNKTKDIPIIFLTDAYVSEEFKKRGFDIGAVDYISKPIDEYQLINRIHVYLKLIEKERKLNILLENKIKAQNNELLMQTEVLRKQSQELKKEKEESAANDAKIMFLANITHELRTPINILLCSTQLMNQYLKNFDDVDKTKFKKQVDIQTQNCNRLLRVVNNLIDITKIDSSNFKLVYTKCNIVNIIEQITMSVVEYIKTKGINVVFDTDIEEKLIMCDLDAIERIVLNLLSNAVKFTPKGGLVCVSIENLQTYVRIIVKDTGIGIHEDMQEIIFERFKQVDNLLTRKNEGSGIGLSLVKALVEMHGGSINVVSKYQCGSEFIVDIPVGDINYEDEYLLDDKYSIQNESKVIKKINIEFSDIYF